MNLVSDGRERALVLGAMAFTIGVVWYMPPTGTDAALAWLVAAAMVIAGSLRLAAGQAVDPGRAPGAGAPRMMGLREIPAAVTRVMDVRIALVHGDTREFRGPLRVDGNGLVAELETALDGAHAELAEDADLGAKLVVTRTPPRRGILRHLAADGMSVVLFLVGAATTLTCGALLAGGSPFARPAELAAGLPFAAVVLGVFTVQALVRTLVLAAHGVRAGAPFFIPLPVPPGTAGAALLARMPHRRALFDATFWGLAAALATAFAALAYGLSKSPVVVSDASPAPGVGVGQSIALAIVARFAVGGSLAYSDHVYFAPIAQGAWLSLWILTLRMIPAGSLDGGSMTRALVGTRAGLAVGRAVRVALLVAAALVKPASLPWLIGAFVFTYRTTSPRDDVTRLSFGRKVAGALIFAIWLLLAVPLPDALYGPAGIHPPRITLPPRGVGLSI
jgi:hypothetical protein